jgi:hypothetical protein
LIEAFLFFFSFWRERREDICFTHFGCHNRVVACSQTPIRTVNKTLIWEQPTCAILLWYDYYFLLHI